MVQITQDANCHVERAIDVAIRHMDLCTAADLACTLVERRLELIFAEVNARKF